MPEMDEGGFVLDYVAPPGTSVTETDRLMRQVEAILHETPEVDTYSRRTGLQLGGGITESNTGDFFIRLKPFPRATSKRSWTEVRERVDKTIPGLEIETPQLMEDLIGDLTAVPQPIEVKLFADDEAALLAAGPAVAEAIEQGAGADRGEVGHGAGRRCVLEDRDRPHASGAGGDDPDEVSKQASPTCSAAAYNRRS